MFTYILKRILLMIPTLLGALTITFIIIQLVPGGPVEQLIAEMRASARAGGEVGGGVQGRRDLDAKQIADRSRI
jgi:microcin C transport system permease protein